MSVGVNRLFINSYLAYKDDVGESLKYFAVDFPQSVIEPKALYVVSASIALTYEHPNISPTQNTLIFDLSGTTYTLSLPTSDRYIGGSNPYGTPGSDFQTTLNVLFQSATSISASPFVFDENNLKFSFDLSSTGQAYVNFNSASTFARRLGLGKSQLDVVWSVPVIKMENSPIVARTQCLYLACSNINDSMNNSTANSRADIMVSIPLTSSAFGDIQVFTLPFPPEIANVGSFSTLVFQILDDEFNPISFQSNTNLSLELHCDYNDVVNAQTSGFKRPTFS